MSYEYKGKTYELKPYTLTVQATAGKLLKEISRLNYEVISGIDTSYLNKYESRKRTLEKRIDQCKAGGKDATQAENELENLVLEMESDKQIHALNKLIEEQTRYIAFELIGNTGLMTETFKVILNEPVTLDYNDEETVPFVNQVIGDFFFLRGINKEQ
jgi:hypothetical protein